MVWDILMEVMDAVLDSMDSGKGAAIILGVAAVGGAGWWFLRHS